MPGAGRGGGAITVARADSISIPIGAYILVKGDDHTQAGMFSWTDTGQGRIKIRRGDESNGAGGALFRSGHRDAFSEAGTLN